METKWVCFVDGRKHFGVSGMISLSNSTGLLTNRACHSTALKVLLCPILFLFMCFWGVKCFLIQIRSAECYRYL